MNHWYCQSCGCGMRSATPSARWRDYCLECDPFTPDERRAYALGWFEGRFHRKQYRAPQPTQGRST